jgi:hypothetical protein
MVSVLLACRNHRVVLTHLQRTSSASQARAVLAVVLLLPSSIIHIYDDEEPLVLCWDVGRRFP